MGAGELAFQNMILNMSYARPFIHVKIISSKIISDSKHRQGQLTCNQTERGRKEFHMRVQQVQLQANYKVFKIKEKLVNH